MPGTDADQTLMEICREGPQRPSLPEHYVFSDKELEEIAREFGEQIPSLNSDHYP